jgi:hypothetical protein
MMTHPSEAISMSSFALSAATTSADAPTAAFGGPSSLNDVVEIGLLLPADWAAALIELSKKRQETVGQILRSFIGRGLVAGE